MDAVDSLWRVLQRHGNHGAGEVCVRDHAGRFLLFRWDAAFVHERSSLTCARCLKWLQNNLFNTLSQSFGNMRSLFLIRCKRFEFLKDWQSSPDWWLFSFLTPRHGHGVRALQAGGGSDSRGKPQFEPTKPHWAGARPHQLPRDVCGCKLPGKCRKSWIHPIVGIKAVRNLRPSRKRRCSRYTWWGPYWPSAWGLSTSWFRPCCHSACSLTSTARRSTWLAWPSECGRCAASSAVSCNTVVVLGGWGGPPEMMR